VCRVQTPPTDLAMEAAKRCFLVVCAVVLAASPAHAGKNLANGVACTFNSDCASGSCTFKVCKAKSGGKKLGNGVACTFNSDCESGSCTFKVCKAKGSGKKLGNGIACSFNSDCESGRCTFKVCKAK
jgi:hypothetical protein